MQIRIRQFKSTRAGQTSGAHTASPAKLISGTAVHALRPDVNTAAMFSGQTFTIGRIFAEAEERPGRVREPITKRRRKKKQAASAKQETNFGMLPGFVLSIPKSESPAVEMRAVNTPLQTKAQEELSEFDRIYPW